MSFFACIESPFGLRAQSASLLWLVSFRWWLALPSPEVMHNRAPRTMHLAGGKAHIHRLKSDLLEFGLFLFCIWPNSGCGLFLYHINVFTVILILTREDEIAFTAGGAAVRLMFGFCRIEVWFSRLLFSFSFFLARVAIHRLLVLFSSISF